MNILALIHLVSWGQASSQPSPLQIPLVLGAMGLLFYAFAIRPQQQQDKAQRAMREGLKRGDQVVTSGGIHAKVAGLSDELVTLEIAERVRVKVERKAVSRLVTEEKQT